ncbi:L,D-transpeptidase [Phreatobacter aquaticus]|uniref:L,D-transpeptidase n=1 Tax=Phreatobacter aquaticus TaxID=2570229 RepID=UPI001C06B740|nr:L,D-transpeptidase [Phreatobacter aquaticus]
MRIVAAILALVASMFLVTTNANAAIVVRVDKSTQTMRVIVDGEHRHTWQVSTGRIGYNTPVGTYSPQRLERNWRSRKYGMAPMPYSIFFRGGYAIHGTTMVSRLGRTDSHGCIRLAPANARVLFDMVAAQRGSTRIVIEGSSPASQPLMASRGAATRVASAPARNAQMGLAQPSAPRAQVAGGQAAPRAAVAAPAPRAVVAVPVASADNPNRFFNDWFLRR